MANRTAASQVQVQALVYTLYVYIQGQALVYTLCTSSTCLPSPTILSRLTHW